MHSSDDHPVRESVREGDASAFPERNPYLLVVGCPRSGTTLLQRMLDSHPRLAVANDTHFITRALQKTALQLSDSVVAGNEVLLTNELVSGVSAYHRFPRLGLPISSLDHAPTRS